MVVLLVFALPVLFFSWPLIQRARVDKAIEPLCAQDGGIRVLEPVRLQRGEFASVLRTQTPSKQVGTILDKYRIIRHHNFIRIDAGPYYKYETHIERISDGHRIAELTTYHRPGDELFHGKSCPASISEADLVAATFLRPNVDSGAGVMAERATDRYTDCPKTNPAILTLTGTTLMPPIQLGQLRPRTNDPTWARELSCQGKTEISLDYTKNDSSTRLTATTILFEDSNAKRCIVRAMASPDRIICARDATYLIGRKSTSFHDDISVAKYSKEGALVSIVTLPNTALGPGRIVGYEESAKQFSIEFVAFEGQKATCRKIVADKPQNAVESLLPPRSLFAQNFPGCAGL